MTLEEYKAMLKEFVDITMADARAGKLFNDPNPKTDELHDLIVEFEANAPRFKVVCKSGSVALNKRTPAWTAGDIYGHYYDVNEAKQKCQELTEVYKTLEWTIEPESPPYKERF